MPDVSTEPWLTLWPILTQQAPRLLLIVVITAVQSNGNCEARNIARTGNRVGAAQAVERKRQCAGDIDRHIVAG